MLTFLTVELTPSDHEFKPVAARTAVVADPAPAKRPGGPEPQRRPGPRPSDAPPGLPSP